MASEDLRVETGASATTLALALFTVPMVVSLLLESAILVWTERMDRRRVVAAALALMAVSQLAVAATDRPWALATALSIWFVGAGVSTGVAELALIAARPDDADRMMARWARYGSIGDLLAPALYTALAGLGLGWRAALGVGSVVAAWNAVLVWRAPELPTTDDDEEAPLGVAIRETAGNRVVWGWLLAAAACTLFDEIFVAFGTLHLREAGVSAVTQGLALTLGAVGAALGMVVTERMLQRHAPERVLLGACAVCVGAFAAWLAAPAWVAVPLTLVIGASTLPMWAIATARAYACTSRPALVAALGTLLSPLEIAAPWILGIVADAWGVRVALVGLFVQPIVVGLVAAVVGRRTAPRR